MSQAGCASAVPDDILLECCQCVCYTKSPCLQYEFFTKADWKQHRTPSHGHYRSKQLRSVQGLLHVPQQRCVTISLLFASGIGSVSRAVHCMKMVGRLSELHLCRGDMEARSSPLLTVR